MRGILDWLDNSGFYTKTVWDTETEKWIGAGTMRLLDFQRRILGHCFTPDEEGNLPYTTVVYAAPKKSGKTTVLALIGAWAAECAPEGSEIYSVANDMEQAQARAFTDIKYHIQRKHDIAGTAYRVEMDNGTFVQAIAQHYASAAGARQFLTMFDELWAYSASFGTKVLTADLRWVDVETLCVGDKLTSFDEERGDRAYRSFRKGTVTAVRHLETRAIRVMLKSGRSLVVTHPHKFLARLDRDRNNIRWVEACNLVPGDKLMRVFEPWAEDRSWDAAYLAAAFDGEGNLSVNPQSLGYSMRFTQRDNEMFEQVKVSGAELGFSFIQNRSQGGTNGDVCALNVGDKYEVTRLLGMTRPRRLLPKFDPDKLGRMIAQEWDEVIGLQEVETAKIAAITVDCQTYFTDGYASHNTSERSRRMWAEMTPPPSVPNAMRVVVTYAGFENESDQLMDLYNMCFKRENGEFVNGEVVPGLEDIVNARGEPVCRRNGDTFVYWETEPRMPWQTPEYYASQMMTLRPADFLRMHRNTWVSSTESFIPTELWDRASRHLQGPLTLFKDHPYRAYPISVGIDIGMKHDCSALVGVYYDAGRRKAGIAFHHIWTPPKDGTVLDLEYTVELQLEKLWKEYQIVSVCYDPTQFQRSAVTLQRKGIPLVEFPQTAGNMIQATQALYDLLKTDNLEAYPDGELRDHIRYASAETTARGFRLVKGRNAKYAIDAAIALAMACFDAVNRGGVNTSDPVQIVSPFSDATTIYIPTIGDIHNMKLPAALRD